VSLRAFCSHPEAAQRPIPSYLEHRVLRLGCQHCREPSPL